ncbi:MAG: tRNA(Ile)-lysidine synthase [Syntrophaceae bacterium PtaU1.Bin231]|nr:MAG: tRNA(Ile)-lysidine synthase [Syntrophaceae bacterium PtaU1.Bin231]
MRKEGGGKAITAIASHPVLSRVRGIILRHRMLAGGETVVVAASGGPDSMALLKVLGGLSEEMALRLVVAHFNHGLRREEGNRDEEFVRKCAENMNLAFECGRADIPRLLPSSGRSTEDLCRRMRYDFLAGVAGRYGARRIALGHHLHDQAETVVMNLLRGSGPRGLRGMQPVRDGLVIRPLLELGRDEILRFLEDCGIDYVRDSSNRSDRFVRNRLRASLVPEMRRFNPRLDATLVRTAEILRSEDEYLQAIVEDRLREWGVPRETEVIGVPVDVLQSLHPALGNRVLKELLERMTPEGTGIGYAHVLAVAEMISRSEPAGEVALPNGVVARRDPAKGLLVLEKSGQGRGGGTSASPFELSVEPPATVAVDVIGAELRFSWADRGGMDFSVEGRVYMDNERITYPLVVRSRRAGDRFQPFGMSGHKKLKDFLIDIKLPRRRRDEMPLVADRESVLWVPPWRLSERVRITGATRRILMVEMKAQK